MSPWVSSPSLEDLGVSWTAVTAGAVLFTAGLIVRGVLNTRNRRAPIPSPRSQLVSTLSKGDFGKLPYPPDVLPGARDITSPYGSIRAYEFGPEDGRKVLMVHGISTPCLALGGVAHGLVAKGCRVLLFDLFGRGYSDNPSDLPQDIRLFSSQIFLILASSPLSWTGYGSGKFSIVGYSLGGGISTAFTSYFPDLVSSLVLIAPAGLLRPYHIGRSNRLLFSESVIPQSILHYFVKQRLKTPLYPTQLTAQETKSAATAAVAAEMPNLEQNSRVPLSKSHPNITIEDAVIWQVENHNGFVSAFMSSIRHGPISSQHEDWRRIGRRLTQQASDSTDSASEHGLENGKVLIVTGNDDVIIRKNELVPDATAVLEGNVVFKFIEAGHEAPIIKSEDVVREIADFWNI